MPIPLHNLDNRTFNDLVEELRALIPGYCPEWTDHNASDPGITLIELFAWVMETLIYRANRIPPASRWRLLQLLIPEESAALPGAADFKSCPDKAALLEMARTVAAANLRTPWRAVTAEDFEEIVLSEFPNVARVRCLADTAPDPLSSGSKLLEGMTGHVSVIIVPLAEGSRTVADPQLLGDVHNRLDERRLITCRHHVIGADYTDVALSAKIVSAPGSINAVVRDAVIDRIARFFAAVAEINGGVRNGGWQFGRDVYESEICSVIEETDGVDHLEAFALLRNDGNGPVVETGKIAVAPNSLVCFDEYESRKMITVTSCR